MKHNAAGLWIALVLSCVFMLAMLCWMQEMEDDITFLKERKEQHIKILQNHELRIRTLEKRK